jgi:SWI/SNF-related matrix-associated actin-dependent regulator 1 of chromatin subfamily A
LELRPFNTVEELNFKLQQGKKKAGPAGISSRMFSDCVEIFSGYGSVDSVLDDCDKIGAQLRTVISSWTSAVEENGEEGALSLGALSAPTNTTSKDCIVTQPALLSANIQLKDYQLSGVSWLRLLYRKKLSCILADEMGKLRVELNLRWITHRTPGLGKTAQVISFFASLKEQGINGPHLVVVPSASTPRHLLGDDG